MKVAKSKRVIFSVAVAFISVFFFAYAIQAVYPGPEDPCNYEPLSKPIEPERSVEIDDTYYDEYNECRKEYREAMKPYERDVFFANLIVGLIVLVAAFFLAIEAVSSGLMGGAVMLIVYGSMRYWGELSDVWRTLMLGVALVVLVWLGYKKLAD